MENRCVSSRCGAQHNTYVCMYVRISHQKFQQLCKNDKLCKQLCVASSFPNPETTQDNSPCPSNVHMTHPPNLSNILITFQYRSSLYIVIIHVYNNIFTVSSVVDTQVYMYPVPSSALKPVVLLCGPW